MADTAREAYIAQTPDYVHVLNDYLYQYRKQARQGLLPFFVEMVDQNGTNVAIPFPPINPEKTEDGKTPSTARYIAGVRLMVNPNSLSLNMSKIVNRTQTMTAWLEEHWGEEIDTVTLQGNNAAFVVGANTLRDTGSQYVRSKASNDLRSRAAARAEFYSSVGIDNFAGESVDSPNLALDPGLTTRFRRYSVSYQEMRKLCEIFSANGCIYDQNGFICDRKYVQLSYDYSCYRGFFESIDVTEDAETPFRFTYTITFKSEKTMFSFVTRK